MTEAKMSLNNGVFIIGIIHLLLLHAGCQGQICQDDLFGDICIVYVSSQFLNWQDARDYCRTQYQGDLVSIEDAARQQDIEDLMIKHSATLVWTGGSEHLDSHWKWKSDKIAQQQGCFTEDSSAPEFAFSPQPQIANATSGVCLPACFFNGYEYAALSGGNRCFCGNSFGKYGTSGDCNKPCVGSPDETCGGASANSVHIFGGAYAGWTHGQPNNIGGNQYCGCLLRTGNTGLQDEPCNNRYPYICDVPVSSCAAINTDTDGSYHLIDINRCYFVSSTSLNWQNARQKCRGKAGDLAELTSAYLQQEAISMSANSPNNRLWIRLTKIDLQWPTGSMQYTNFAAQNPSSSPGHCVQILASDNYKWSDTSCDLSRNFYCEFDITKVTTTTTTSTTTTTTTPKPTTPTTTTPTTTTTPKPTTTTTVPPTTTTTSSTTSTTPSTTTAESTAAFTTTTTVPQDSTTTDQSVDQTTSSTATDGRAGNSDGQAQAPEAGQASDTSSSNNVGLIVGLVILVILIILVIICIIAVVVMRRQKEKRKALQPQTFIPYTSNTDVKQYMSGPAFNISPRPEKPAKLPKTSHATQTSDRNPVNNYTKHMAVQRDGTVSDIGSGTTDAASVTIIREEKARSKPPHTPIVYHENGTAKRKHGRYVQNRVITPSARAFNSDTDLGHDASRHHQTPSTMYDSDTANARHGRHRSRSNKVYHSDNEMAEDARDSDGDRKSRVHRYPDPDQNDMKKPSRDARGKERQTEKSYTSDTDDTARYEHSMSILDRLYRAQEKDRHNSPSLNSRNVPRQEDDKTGVREHGSEEEETYGKYKDPRPKSGKQERKMMSTTDDSESEIRKGGNQMKVFLETDDEENPATSGPRKKKLKQCPECNERVRMLWKHLVSTHGMAPGSEQLQDAMERSKILDKKARKADLL